MKEINKDKTKNNSKKFIVNEDANNIINNNKNLKNIKKSKQQYKYNSLNLSPKSFKNINKENKLYFTFSSELEQLENFFVKQFMLETKGKSDKEINNIIPKKKLDYENRIKLLLTKAKNEIVAHLGQYKSAEKRNIELKNNLIMITKQKNRLYEDLKEADMSIEKINKKYEMFNQLKQYFDSIIFEFNINEKDLENKSDNKYNLEENINYRKICEKELGKELEENQEILKKMKDKARNEEILNKKENLKLYNYFIELEKNDKIEEDIYKEKLTNIKEDSKINKMILKENDLILNTFISIYNLFYKTLNLQRDLIEKPKNINLIKSDYSPQTYLTEEMFNYINLMLRNSTDESCGLLLREIVSYANMMLREENVEFNKKKYDPIKTINEIEKYISKTKEENNSLKNEIENRQKEITKENEYIKKLDSQIKEINTMIDMLNKTLKTIYTDNSKGKCIKKSLSAHNFKFSDDKILDKSNKKHLLYLKKNIEAKNDDKIEFARGMENLIEHINRINFYKDQHNIKPKEYNVQENAFKRIKRKFFKLKKLQLNKNKYTSLENALTGNIKGNIEKLLFKINQEIKEEK